MVIVERLSASNNGRQVSFHQFTEYIDFIEFLYGLRQLDGVDSYQVLVWEQPEDFEFSQRPFSKCFVIKRFFNFLNGYLVLSENVFSCYYDPISSRTNVVENFVSTIYKERRASDASWL